MTLQNEERLQHLNIAHQEDKRIWLKLIEIRIKSLPLTESQTNGLKAKKSDNPQVQSQL